MASFGGRASVLLPPAAALLLCVGCATVEARAAIGRPGGQRRSARRVSPRRLPRRLARPATGTPRSPAVRPAGPPAPAAVAWQIPPRHARGISGFADRTSVRSGQPVTLYVSTAAPSFTVLALRMGWYGGGRLVRQVWRSAVTAGHRQPGPRLVAAATRTYAATWTPSLTVPATGWPPGDYLLRLDAGTGGENYVPLTARGPRHGAAPATARAAGTNLTFFGANAIFRRIRFGPTRLGPDRLEINYKVAAEDPVDDSCASPVSARTESVTRRVTAAVLRAFARGPAAVRHPAVDNLAALGIG